MPITEPQQLNKADRLAIRKVIVDRCAASVAQYALYLLGNQAATAQQTAWAKSAIFNTATIGDQVSWHVTNQASFLNGGSSIDDAELQAIVEAAINAHFVAPEPE